MGAWGPDGISGLPGPVPGGIVAARVVVAGVARISAGRNVGTGRRHRGNSGGSRSARRYCDTARPDRCGCRPASSADRPRTVKPAIVARIVGRIRVGQGRIDVVIWHGHRRWREGGRRSDGRSRRRPGRFGQGHRPSVANLWRLGREDRRRREGAVCGGTAAAVGRCVDGHAGAMVCAVLSAIPVEPPLLDHAGSSLTAELGRLALPKTNGRIAPITSTNPTPKPA